MIKERHIRSEALLLCGGLSKRFGQDKRFLIVRGIPLFLYQYKKLKSCFISVKVLIKNEDTLYKFLPREDIIFEKENDNAMLIGIYNGLKNLKGDEGFFLAVDMLNIPVELMRKIFKYKNFLAVFPFYNDKIHFGCSLINKKAINIIEEKILNKEYALKNLIKNDDFFIWNIEKEEWAKKYNNLFFNINKKEDLIYERHSNYWRKRTR